MKVQTRRTVETTITLGSRETQILRGLLQNFEVPDGNGPEAAAFVKELFESLPKPEGVRGS